MKSTTATLLLFIAGAAGAAAGIGTLINSPIDGIVEIEVEGKEKDRHYLNAAQIVRVHTGAWSNKEDGSRDLTSVVITTTATEQYSRRGGEGGSQSVSYVFSYKTRPEAGEAVKQILAESSVANGAKAPAAKTAE